MTLLEKIQERLRQLPTERQYEALDFIEFLYQRAGINQTVKPRSLQDHPAFGAWKNRQVNAVKYQQDVRAEWDVS